MDGPRSGRQRCYRTLLRRLLRLLYSREHEAPEFSFHPQESNGEAGLGLTHHLSDGMQPSLRLLLEEIHVDLRTGLKAVGCLTYMSTSQGDVQNQPAAFDLSRGEVDEAWHARVNPIRYARSATAFTPNCFGGRATRAHWMPLRSALPLRHNVRRAVGLLLRGGSGRKGPFSATPQGWISTPGLTAVFAPPAGALSATSSATRLRAVARETPSARAS